MNVYFCLSVTKTRREKNETVLCSTGIGLNSLVWGKKVNENNLDIKWAFEAIFFFLSLD